MSAIEIQNLGYTYDSKRMILQNINVSMEKGKVYAIIGSSGCGKTTLLSLLGGLDIPQNGKILFQGKDITERGLGYHRRHNISFVFQGYNLIEYLNPIENIKVSSQLDPEPFLLKVGLTKEEARRNILKLSGGQQQRVAIARALASEAEVILADEPTGNLDEDTAKDIAHLLFESAHQLNKCVVIVTHSAQLADEADVILQLRKGSLNPISKPGGLGKV